MDKMTEHRTKWLSLWRTVIMLLPLLIGCHPGGWGTPIDRSILTDDPCAAPCWQGIVPGTTTSSEAADILTTLEFIKLDDLWSFGDDLRWRTSVSREDPAIVSEIRSRDGIVDFMEIGIDFELALEEVLDKYGSPEKFLAYDSAREERIQTEIYFYYPRQGLVFVSWASGYVPPSESFMLDATTPITLVYYFVPTTMDAWLDEYPEIARRMRFGREHLQDWSGLGPIEVLH